MMIVVKKVQNNYMSGKCHIHLAYDIPSPEIVVGCLFFKQMT